MGTPSDGNLNLRIWKAFEKPIGKIRLSAIKHQNSNNAGEAPDTLLGGTCAGQ